MLSGMGLGDPGASGEGGDLDFAPMMQNMMKGLMSKEVLYPSLKEISDKVRHELMSKEVLYPSRKYRTR